jgi:alkylhydroperoxidase family enzyme
VTRVADGHVSGDVFVSARDHFSEEELVNLTIAVIATNAWNRLNIAFRPEVGDYRPGMFDLPKAAQAAI